MRRWGQIPESKPAGWYEETIKNIYRPDIWEKAAALLAEEGYLTKDEIPETDGYKAPTSDFIDGLTYDGKDPIGYINSFAIGNKD
jgi:nitrate/nitrite transport system substrate-binding protein